MMKNQKLDLRIFRRQCTFYLMLLAVIFLVSGKLQAQTYFADDFEATFTGSPASPPGWSQTRIQLFGGTTPAANAVDGPKDWQQNTYSGSVWSLSTFGGATYQPAGGAQSGTKVLYIQDSYFGSTTSTTLGARRVESPSMNLTASTSPYLRFFYTYGLTASNSASMLRVLASADGGLTWKIIMSVPSDATNIWRRINVSIPTAYRTANAKIGFEMTNTWGSGDMFIDNLTVQEFTPTTITSAATGNWSAAATWVGGVVPNCDNDVVIATGHTVGMDQNMTRCQNVTVNGTLQYNSTTATILTHIFGNLTVNSGGLYNSFFSTTGKRTYLGGSLLNDGTINFSVGAGLIAWLGGAPATYSGSGSTSTFVSNLWHANSGGVTYNAPLQVRNTVDLLDGDINPNGNLTVGNSAVATQTIEVAHGRFTQQPIWGTGVTRTTSYIDGIVNIVQIAPQTILTGNENQIVSGAGTMGSLTMNTWGNVQFTYPVTMGTGAAGTLTLTRGIIINNTTNVLTINNTASAGVTGTAPSTAAIPLTHGSYVTGAVKINFGATATTRTFPLGIGTAFNSAGTGALPNSNVLKQVAIATTTAFTAATSLTVSNESAGSGSLIAPVTNLMGINAYRINRNGGPDLPANATITIRGINYTFGGGTNSDNLAGSQDQMRIVQSQALSGPWSERSAASGSGAFVNNTFYARTSATTAPGPISTLATNGEYFAFANTVPNTDIGVTAVVSPQSSGCFGTSNTFTVTVKNFALVPIDLGAAGATLSGSITDPSSITTNLGSIGLTGVLAAGATANFNLTTTYDMSAFGTYLFNANTAVAGDGNPANDLVAVYTVTAAPLSVVAAASVASFCGGNTAYLNTNFIEASDPLIRFSEITLFRTGTGATAVYPAYVEATAQDFAEITNFGASSVDISGWKLEVSGGGARNYTFLPGTIIPANGVLVLHIGPGTDSPANRYYNTGGGLDFLGSTAASGFVIKNLANKIIDVVAVNGFSMVGVSGTTANDWSGTIASSSGRAGVIRTKMDTNNASDWVLANTSPLQTIGTLNTVTTQLNIGTVTWNPGSISGSSIFVTPSSTTTYTATVVTSTCSANSNNLSITVTPSDPTPSATGDTRCGPGTVNLSASGSGGTLIWTPASAGQIVNTGTSYSPSVTTSGSYSIREYSSVTTQNLGYTGLTQAPAGYFPTTAQWVPFDVITANGIMINSVQIFSNAPVGTPFTIALQDAASVTYATVSGLTNYQNTAAVTPVSPQTVTLNFFVPQGNGWKLVPVVNPNLAVHQTGTGIGLSSIPNILMHYGYGDAGGAFANTSGFFYNWSVSYGCISNAALASYTVNTPPLLSITPSGPTTYCGSGSVGLTASGTGYTNFSWTPSTGLSSTSGATVTASPTVTTTYTVTADDGTGPTGCVSVQTITVTVNATPLVTLNSYSPDVCLGGTQQITAVGGSQGFKRIGTREDLSFVTGGIFNGGNFAQRSQMIFTAAELNAAGLYGPGNITGIGFQVSSKLSAQPYTGFTISVANTALTQFTSGNYEAPVFTTVYNSNYSSVLGWNDILFQTAYVWDGVSNIIVQTCFTNATQGFFDQVYTSSTSPNNMFNSINAAACSATASQLNLDRPNVRFTGGTVNYLWSPNDGNLSAVNVANPIFTGSSLGNYSYTVTVTDPGTGCQASNSSLTLQVVPPPSGGIVSGPSSGCSGASLSAITEAGGSGTYQWQVNINGAGFVDVASQTSSTINYTPLVAGTYVFRNKRSVAGCSDAFSATSLSVTVGTTPTANATATPGTVCVGGNIQLNTAISTTNSLTYCTTSLTSGDYCGAGNGRLTNVTLSGTSLNNNSVCNYTVATGSYTSYPPTGSTTANVLPGQTYNLSVSCESSAIVSVWIDYNHNGTFDATEWTQVYTSGTTGSVSITIPPSPYLGATGMRVRSRLELNQNGSGDACLTMGSGSTDDYTILIGNPSPVGVTYDWSTNPLFLSATNIINPVAQAITSNQTYTVVVTETASGCSSTSSISVSVNPVPDLSTSGGGSACAGNGITLSVSNNAPGQTSGNTYSWTTDAVTPFTSTQQTPSVTGSSTVNNSGNYTVVVTNSFLCTSSAIEVVTVNPNPVLNIISTQNVGCVGGSDGSITVGATTGAPNYDFTADFVTFVNDPAQGTITNLPTGSTTIYVSDGNGCNSQISASLTAISSVPPSANVIVPFIGMPANVCSGTTATLSIPSVSNATMYIWDAPAGAYFNGNVLNVSPFTTSTPSVTVTYGNPSGSLYSTGVQAANGCGASIRKIQKTRGTVSVPAAVSGALTACASSSGTYSTGAVDAASSYLWTVSGDATVSGTGTTATVTFGPAWIGGTLCVSAQTTCYTSAAKCISISKNAAALGSISGTFTACPNTTLSYNVPVSSGAASYAWTVPTGASVSSGQGTNSVNVTFAPGYSAVGSICVSVTSVCGVTSALKCKTVAPGLPTVPASITGASSGLCGQTIAYSCPSQGGGTTYNWTSPGTINSGQGSTSISTTFASLTTGSVCVTASNSCGSSAARCVAVKGAPNAPGAITATPSSWCANTAGIEFNTTTSALTGSYTLSWAYPPAAVVTYAFGGGNSTSLILDWKTGSGNVNVTASNACGASTKTSTWSSTCREGSVSMVSSMSVSPNPTTGVININYTASKGSTVINVLDLAGRVVMTENTNSVEGVNNTQLDMSRLAKGAYMLSVQSTQGNKQVRVVVE